MPTRRRLLRGLARREDGLALLCEVLNVDFSDRPIDQPFSDEELASMSWQGLRDQVVAGSGKANPSVEDFVDVSGRGGLNGSGYPLIGTPDQIADQMEEWFGTCCDGFVIAATSVPGTYEDFARLVVPVLQRRGLVRTDYLGVTLRSNLGLELPEGPASL